MHPGKSLIRKRKKEVKIETISIQSEFVAAKGKCACQVRKKRKLEEAEDLGTSASAKKTKQLK